MKEITEEYINDTIERLLEAKVDLTDYAHFSRSYKRYIKNFDKAKKLISYSNDTSSLFPLENPRELIYKYTLNLNKKEQDEFLDRYNRKQVNIKYVWMFDDLDREEKWGGF
jgi:hypothetical protein